MIDFVTPVAPDRDLGKEYNRVMRNAQNPWVCIRDCDTMFLTPMDGVYDVMRRAIEVHPDCGLFSCITNRIYWPHQRYDDEACDPVPDILYHRRIAESMMKAPSLIMDFSNKPISGFCMLLSKAWWNRVGGFPEGGKLLHVDKQFSKKCLALGPIGIIRNIYVFHYYRLHSNHTDKSHLV